MGNRAPETFAPFRPLGQLPRRILWTLSCVLHDTVLRFAELWVRTCDRNDVIGMDLFLDATSYTPTLNAAFDALTIMM